MVTPDWYVKTDAGEEGAFSGESKLPPLEFVSDVEEVPYVRFFSRRNWKGLLIIGSIVAVLVVTPYWQDYQKFRSRLAYYTMRSVRDTESVRRTHDPFKISTHASAVESTNDAIDLYRNGYINREELEDTLDAYYEVTRSLTGD